MVGRVPVDIEEEPIRENLPNKLKMGDSSEGMMFVVKARVSGHDAPGFGKKATS